jgi:AraC-like DNA-binding protein
MTLVQRVELVTHDRDAIAPMMQQMYAEHQTRLRFTDPSQVRASTQTVAAGPLTAGVISWQGVEYQAREALSHGVLYGVVTLAGQGILAQGRDETPFTAGDTFLGPPFGPYAMDMHQCEFAILGVPLAAAAELAWEQYGISPASVRFDGRSPVSAAAAGWWRRTVAFAYQQLVSSGITEIHPAVIQELTRTAAAVLLTTFPNTTMTLAYLPGPAWAPPVSVRRAAEFIQAHADQPVTMTGVAAAAGVSARALQYAFRRHYGTTPAGYLRRVRLEKAHQELTGASPAGGLTVGAVAHRWGWASHSQFTVAYRQRFGVLPSHTLRA